MKKLILLFSFSLFFSGLMFGQFKMNDRGYVASNNITLDGAVGAKPTGSGVLTVKSNRVDPNYNSMFDLPPCLISTINQRIGYSYMNVYQNGVNFYVNYNGQIYSKLGLVTTSDSLCKENIADLEPTMSRIRRLHGVTFDYKDEPSVQTRSALSADETAPEFSEGATPEISRQIREEKSRKRIGLLAQEVERVFPEAVRTSFDGTKGILYNDLVGVLIEGMKELQDSLSVQTMRNDEMRRELDLIRSELAALTNPRPAAPQAEAPASSGTNTPARDGARLDQNTPNPFNQETEIGYRLSGKAGSASVCIYNLNGQQLKKYPLDIDTLSGKVTVSASEFTPGIYIYSLVIDNRMIDSKRMTLTD